MDELLRTALSAADAAARAHRRRSGRVGVAGATEKGYSDFVSQVDLEAQRAALAVIRERHPDHGILAEEDDAEDDTRFAAAGSRPAGESAPLWVVDPLDGTTNFLHSHPMYAASVGVFVDGEPAAGAVVCSRTGERWWAARGSGAYKDGRRIRVSGHGDLRTALVGTGFPFKVLEMLPEYMSQLDRVLRSSAGIRRGGAAALDLCYLAQGTFDGFWELFLKPWDVAAGIVIVREAGGCVTRIDGSAVGLEEGSILAANSGEMREALARVVRGEDHAAE